MLPYYHPTSIVIVDDDALFVDSLAFSLSDDLLCKTFSEPARALDELQARKSAIRKLEHFVVPSAGQSDLPDFRPGDQLVHLRGSAIANLVVDPSRFEQVSVVVVDYDI